MHSCSDLSWLYCKRKRLNSDGLQSIIAVQRLGVKSVVPNQACQQARDPGRTILRSAGVTQPYAPVRMKLVYALARTSRIGLKGSLAAESACHRDCDASIPR
jgi:hypothetical protein